MSIPSQTVLARQPALDIENSKLPLRLRPPLARKAAEIAADFSSAAGAVVALVLVARFAPGALLPSCLAVVALAAMTGFAVDGVLRGRVPSISMENVRLEIGRLGAVGLILGAMLLLIYGELAKTLTFLTLWAVSALLINFAATALLERATAGRSFKHRVALCGVGGLVADEVAALKSSDRTQVSGVFDFDGTGAMRQLQAARLAEFVRGEGCDSVLALVPAQAHEVLELIVASLKTLPIEVRACVKLEGTDEVAGGRHVEFVLQEPPLSPAQELLKNAMDYILGALGLVLLSPLILAIAIAIKMDTPGPVFFVQNRGGRSGRPIRVYKFRTMITLENGQKVTQATKDDARVTRVGKFLRSSSLDELPQLINVVRGEMSLVGPRPHAVAHDKLYQGMFRSYESRFRVKPGITGWAQVNGLRGSTQEPSKMRRRVLFDNCYINRWSPWLDLKIIAMTVFLVFKDDNAY